MTTHSLMINHQQSTNDAWVLAPGQVRSLTTGPGERLLRVSQGRVWLTVPGDATISLSATDEAAGVNGRFLWIEDGLQDPIPSWDDDGDLQPWRK